ncbi:MAG: nuclear transport factor 2 family protein [Aliidongia sp.]
MQADDYVAIQNLIHRYCDRIDRADFDGLGQLFTEADVYLPATDQWFRRDPAGLAAMYRNWVRLHADGTPRTRHVTTNLIIDAEGPDRIRTQSYILVYQDAPGCPLQPIVGGRYADRFVKADGIWRFAERRMEIDMFGNLSAHMLQEFGPG